jgi:hypothetical protein
MTQVWPTGRLRQRPVAAVRRTRRPKQCPLRTLPQSAVAGLQEAVARPASAGRVQPAPPGVPDLAAEPLAELLAHVGHGRPLQGQGLLARQPANRRS